MKVLTEAQMREVDRLTSERYGISSQTLMENAGTRVVELLNSVAAENLKRGVAVLCGKGNNGGDGLVVARLLKNQGAKVTVLLFARPNDVRGDAAANLKRWQESGGEVRVVTTPEDWTAARASVVGAGVMVDALLGTGLRGKAEGLLRTVIEDLNAARVDALVVAVDVPSGLSAENGIAPGAVLRADYTVAFTAPKVSLVKSPEARCAGKLVVGDIGSPRELLGDGVKSDLHWLEPGEFHRLLLRRTADAHKGDFGHALIVAGSRGKTGAAVLAGSGALRAGAGLVTVATPGSVLPIVAGGLQELMTEPLADTEAGSISLQSLDYDRFWKIVEGKNCVALGPGLSLHPETQAFAREVVARCEVPLIVDADGLNAYAGRAAELGKHRSAFLALTPHPGEMARLLGASAADVKSRRLEVALEAAREWNAWVVLKGQRTVVATPDGQAFVNSTGNPGMATAGTGDVLTGILAGLTAQFGTADWARVLGFGVYLHGLAGDIAAQHTGEAPLVASDVLAALPQAYQAVLRDSSGA